MLNGDEGTDEEALLEQEEEMAMVRRVVHEALVQMSGGKPPFLLQGEEPKAAEQEEKKAETCTNNGVTMSLAEWRNYLARLCQDSVQRTTKGDVSDLSNGKPWDYEARVVHCLYNRFNPKTKVNKKKRKQKKSRTRRSSHGPLVLTSEYGVERSVHSSVEFATALLPGLEEGLPRGWDVRVKASSGNLLLVSPARARALRRAGRRPCPSCEVWTKSKLTSTGVPIPNAAEKGLWWHQQQFHDTTHATATAFAASTRNSHALMLYEEAQVLQLEQMICRPTTTKDDHSPTATDTPAARKAQAFQFAQRGDLPALQLAIQNHWVDPRMDVDRRGASLLLWAAGAGHVSLCRYLIEDCHCNPRQGQQQYRARSFANRTALHWACRNGHLEVVQYLIQHCGPVILQDATADGTTAVGWAAWQGRLDILQWLYSQYPKEVARAANRVNQFGCHALLWAAQGPDTDDNTSTATLEWLASTARVRITHINDNGHGMLHKAGQRNRPSVAVWFCQRLLLQQELGVGENVTTTGGGGEKTDPLIMLRLIGPDREGCTPSDLAGIEGHTELAKQVATMEEKVLQRAVRAGAKWPTDWNVDETVLKDEWKPGCGLLRLWLAYKNDNHSAGL